MMLTRLRVLIETMSGAAQKLKLTIGTRAHRTFQKNSRLLLGGNARNLLSHFCRERLRANGSPATKGLDPGDGKLRTMSLDRQGHRKSAQAGPAV